MMRSNQLILALGSLLFLFSCSSNEKSSTTGWEYNNSKNGGFETNNKFKEQIEMELIQQQANDNTFDILTGKVTMEELIKGNNDNIPFLIQSKEMVDIEDRLDVLEGMIEYYTEGEEYEKCAELVKLKNKLWS